MNAEIQPTSIAEKNDQLRSLLPNFPSPHRFVITDKIAVLSETQRLWLIEQVRNYSKFNEDDDPYDEHDFGIIPFKEHTIFWKFDYFTTDFKTHRKDGIRVLTLMFEDEL